MDALLELIFNNIFFVAIIISAIYGYVKNSMDASNKQHERSTQKRKPMQFDNEQHQYDDSRMTEMEKERKRVEAERNIEEITQPSNIRNNKMEKVIEIKKQDHQKRVKLKKLLVTKNEVVNGFIWSKILDEPRSKKPYKYRR
jgi:hypothetical protein